MLTAERLRELVTYDPDTGVMKRCVSISPRTHIGDVVGGLTKRGYLVGRIDGKKYPIHRLAWLYVHGRWPDGEVDHINEDKTDNRFLNLRDVSKSINLHNISYSQGSSGYRGVTWHKGKWMAQYRLDKKTKFIGYFDDPKVAHEAYLAKKKELGLLPVDKPKRG